jgi:hypothetical protein
VRNRHKFYLSLGLLLVSALSSLAQSSQSAGVSAGSTTQNDQTVLAANLGAAPASSDTSSNSALPDAPSAKQPDAAGQENSLVTPAYSRKQQGAPPAAFGGPLGMEGRTADKKFWGANGAMFGSTIANIELTQRCQKNLTCSYVPKSLNTRFAMYGIAMPVEVGVMYMSYHAKERHRSWWYMPSATFAAANTIVAIHAFHRAREPFGNITP